MEYGRKAVAKTTEKLKPTALKSLRAGYHNDGGGLYIKVAKAGSKSWVFRYRTRDASRRLREMGLGSFARIGLAEARDLAKTASAQIQAGLDPIEKRRADRGIKRDADEKTQMTFKRAAGTYITTNKSGWTKQHAKKWEQHFVNQVYDKFGNVMVGQIDITHIKRVLDPIWSTKPALAKLLRQHIEAVLDFAVVSLKLNRDPDGKPIPWANPARWDGHLEHIYRNRHTADSEHQLSLPYEKAPAFMAELRARDTVPSKAFQFMTLTATRSKETLQAKWIEINFDAAVWTIPKARMGKSKREHKVPLSAPAMAILHDMERLKVSDYVFPGVKPRQPLGDNALQRLKNAMGYDGVLTAHGMRATFRSWADESTDYDHDVKEMALAHAIKSGTEAAYRRTTMFEKRKALMANWGKYCTRLPADAEGNVGEARGFAAAQ
jgi:integrase